MRARIVLASLACALVLAAPADAVSGATLPAGWSRAGWRLTALTVPAEVYGAASFPLPRTPPGACGPSDALRAQMPPNGVIVIVESWGQIGQHDVYRPLGSHVRLGRAADFECGGWGYNVVFRVGSEDLQASVIVKGRPGARRLDQVRQLLASIRQ
jgi:hypothetical protein